MLHYPDQPKVRLRHNSIHEFSLANPFLVLWLRTKKNGDYAFIIIRHERAAAREFHDPRFGPWGQAEPSITPS